MTDKVAPTQRLTIADEGERYRRLTRLIFAVIWFIPALLATLQWMLVADIPEKNYGFLTVFVWQGAGWLLWIVWSQMILTLVSVVPLGTGRTARWVMVHAAATLLACAVNSLTIAWMDHTFSTAPEHPFSLDLRTALINNLDFQLVLYWAVLGAAYMVEYVRRYRERNREAAELEQKLARTQLDALRMQLNPHFLFNALNSVAELMEMDVDEAQRTLTRVSDLLRLSLRSAGSSVIPLWQEIELVELYLQIARVRYGGGLEVDLDIDSSTVDLQVPSFLLQPLVENALKHGLAPGHGEQSIRVVSRRLSNTLQLIVEDNGRGLDGSMTTSGRFLAATPAIDGLGIGLTNTRSRLAMLYGERFAFRMNNQADGGCRVEIRLPLE